MGIYDASQTPALRLAIISAVALCVMGCMPNQKKFEEQVHGSIQLGMAKEAAVAEFVRMHMTCKIIAHYPPPPMPAIEEDPGRWLACTKTIQPPLPSSCLERAEIQIGEDGNVKRLNVDQVICAGL